MTETKDMDTPWTWCLFCGEPGADRYTETADHRGTAHAGCVLAWLDLEPRLAKGRWPKIAARMRQGKV